VGSGERPTLRRPVAREPRDGTAWSGREPLAYRRHAGPGDGHAAAGVTTRLIGDLVEGGPETNSPRDLLSTGFLVWLYTIIAFAFLYWGLDGGGTQARALAAPEFPDLAFPEQLNPAWAPPGWRPEFFDYLYLGFTNATALSPTDVMPLSAGPSWLWRCRRLLRSPFWGW
jgi:hypothetical protein